MGSSRFIHIPATGSGGPGPDPGPTPVIEGETRLIVYHPVFDSSIGFFATHAHSWTCLWDDDYVEANTLVDYAQWLFNSGGDDGVIIRWYDSDPRGWWWKVGVNLIDDHPGGGTLGIDIQDGFSGSEDDSNCNPSLNTPAGQTKNQVLNFSEADPLSQCTGVDVGQSSGSDGPVDFDPEFCICDLEPEVICLQVADLTWVATGSVPPALPPSNLGARKYAYSCIGIP